MARLAYLWRFKLITISQRLRFVHRGHFPSMLCASTFMLMDLQTVVYDLFKKLLGSGPVYAALGNHDSYNQSVG